MRAFTLLVILSSCSRGHANLDPIKNILDCTLKIGPGKCLNALTAWRAEKAIDHPEAYPNLTQDLQHFPWSKYSNKTDEQLYSQVCQGTERLLRRRPLILTAIPGYRFELLSKGNGILHVDAYRDGETVTARSSMKKAKKAFYKIMPFMVLPGLMMSAILPFVLPALKMMVMGVGMLNNMALTGAVFTLLRNNAFNDKYEHKIIYVNEGYKNEKHAHHSHSHVEHESQGYGYPAHEEEYQFAESHPVAVPDIPEIETVEELPLNSDWNKQYYGHGQNVQVVQTGNRVRRGDGINSAGKRVSNTTNH